MSERQKRLIEVYEYARAHFGIHTKQGFAEAVNYGRTSMSAALNGNEGYLTDSLFKNICNAFPGVFDLNYLLTGEGSLLVTEQEQKQNEKPNSFSSAASEFKKFEEKITQMQKTMDALREAVESQGIALRVQQQLIDRYRAELNNATPYTGIIASDDTIANLMDEKNPKDK